MSSGKDRAVSAKTLICLLQGLIGEVTTVELRNETHVTGMIQHVDGNMNTEIKDATMISPSGERHHLSDFFVQGKQIRFVQIPEHIDIVKAIETQLEVIRRPLTYQERLKPRIKTISNS